MSLQTAFEITHQDVENAFEDPLSTSEIDWLYDNIDCDRASHSALHGTDMDEQTEYAYQDIQEQIKEPLTTSLYFHVPAIRSTFEAKTLHEGFMCIRNGGQEVPEFVYEKIKEAYTAGHDIRDYLPKEKD